MSFLDGHSEVVALDTVAAYATERENPANRLAVDQVSISYPSPYLADGVVLVDTPGVGSVYAHNTRTAYDFLPHADAAIFVTSADPPVSAAELEFLADCRGFASRMFFVLNKVDYLSGADQAEALDFTTAALTDALGPEPKVYPLSARLALQAAQGGDEVAREGSGLPTFERDFRGFLLRDRARLLLASIAKAGLKVTADEGNRIAVAEQAARLPIDELTRRAERMEALFAEARAQRQDVRALLRRDIEVLTARMEEDLATFAARTRPELTQRGQLYLETTADAGLGSLDERIRQLITRSVEAWREEEEPTVAAELERRLSRSLAATDELLRQTVALCAGIMEVTLTPVTAPASTARGAGSPWIFRTGADLDGRPAPRPDRLSVFPMSYRSPHRAWNTVPVERGELRTRGGTLLVDACEVGGIDLDRLGQPGGQGVLVKPEVKRN